MMEEEHAWANQEKSREFISTLQNISFCAPPSCRFLEWHEASIIYSPSFLLEITPLLSWEQRFNRAVLKPLRQDGKEQFFCTKVNPSQSEKAKPVTELEESLGVNLIWSINSTSLSFSLFLTHKLLSPSFYSSCITSRTSPKRDIPSPQKKRRESSLAGLFSLWLCLSFFRSSWIH